MRKKVGQGAMGVVWQAYDEQLQRVVAAKALLALDGLDDARVARAKARAMREARLSARLEHPNAIRVYDVVEEDGQPWLIMEYLPSRSLAAVIAEQGTLPPREVARIGCYTAAALAAAHRHGIQHRDVKPGNVLIGDQEVKITDFGISRATGEDATATATGTVGTPAFFSPEVARGEDAGLPSDVFSLGATLYNAVEGEPPFGTSENTIAMLHRVASGSIMPPANAGPLLAPVLFRLLANEPDRRPTMEEAVHLLAAVVNESPQGSEATVVIPSTVELPVEAQPEEKSKKGAGTAAAGLVAGAAAAEAAGLTAPPAAAKEPEPAAEEPVAEPVAEEPEPAAEEPQPAPVEEKAAAESSEDKTVAATTPAVAAATPVLPAPEPARPAPVTPPPPAPAAQEEERRRSPLVPVAIVLLVLAVGFGAFFLWPKGDSSQANNPPAAGDSGTNTPAPDQGQQDPQSQLQTTTTTETQSTPPAESTAETPPATDPGQGQNPPPPAGPKNAQEAITAYYALIPGDLQTSYSLLTDRFKSVRSPSFQNYQSWWSQFSGVQLSDFAPQGDNVVTVSVTYLQGGGVHSTERHTYTFVQQNGKWMIDNQA
ncbi:serine/threonine-protein kinase [Lentzea fradiae]|uniref:serine/threonine-protein kinase n=1 Tax=Lentzea fradiae TaxID=200378 RepID=UPI002481FB0B|nr:serine/threonine-protein kinase [Lentzea fradiae]